VSNRTYPKRTAALAFAAALAGSAVLMAAPAAQADVVDVNYQCKTPIGDKSAVSPIDIKSVQSGGGYKLTMSWQKGVSSSPVELGKGAMSPSAVIKVAGADSGTVAVSGPANAAAIPANTPIKISDLSGTYTPKKTGKVTFTAGVLTIKALGTTTTCTPSNNPKPSLTLDVTAASGGSGSSGSSGSSQAGSDSGGQLPQTGPEDSAIALGTLGGTVLLAGAAGVLWLTRRHQAVRR
jgi:LPXTG-motif cell wall-anchored protein